MKVAVFTTGYRRKTRKDVLLKLLGLSYFGFMILFGVVYWILANYSWGDFFIFQEDIHLNTKINAFKGAFGLNSSRATNESIGRLIRSDEYKRPVARLDTGKGNTYFISMGGELGEKWAEYYYSMLGDKGVTHIAIKKVDEIRLLDKYDTHKLQIELYKSRVKDSIYMLAGHNKKDVKNFKLVGEISIWVLNYPELRESFLFNNEFYYYPIDYTFKNLMKSSLSFPDSSPDVLERVVNGRFTYPFLDFMYFSTVTITTLGYGDILPNSTLVRFLVMLESIIGVIIIGAFVSCFFLDMGGSRPV